MSPGLKFRSSLWATFPLPCIDLGLAERATFLAGEDVGLVGCFDSEGFCSAAGGAEVSASGSASGSSSSRAWGGASLVGSEGESA